jgi:hypothetical protein
MVRILALAIAAMIIGELLDWWFPTPGRSAFATTFALVLLAVWGSRHAYLCGVADAITRSQTQPDDSPKA